MNGFFKNISKSNSYIGFEFIISFLYDNNAPIEVYLISKFMINRFYMILYQLYQM